MIIGITGTDGAGKGTVVDYLVKQKGFTHYSSRTLLLKEIEARGLEPTRNQMRLVANELRATHGNEFVVKTALDAARQSGAENIVVESIRAIAEAEYLKIHNGILLAVDADQQIRYERVQSRRSETDKVSFEEFVAHEELEKNDPDPNGMQKAKVIEMADHTIMNNGSFEELESQVKSVLALIHD